MTRSEPKYSIGDTITNGNITFTIEREPLWDSLLKDWWYEDPADPEWCGLSEDDAELCEPERSGNQVLADLYMKARAL